MPQPQRQLDRLRLRHLRLLELIDQQGSLRAIGGILNLTQPAISQMVKDLEEAFGATLVERSPRGVALCEAGHQALQRARAGLATFDQLALELGAEQPLTVRVGTNPALMFKLLPAALRRLDLEAGKVQFKLHTGLVGDMLQALANGELDCYAGHIDWDQVPTHLASRFRHEPVTQTDLVLACASTHPLARRRKLCARDLLGYSWALPSTGSSNRITFDAAFRNLGLKAPEPTVEVTADPGALITLAAQMDLLTVVARLTFDAQLAIGKVKVLTVPDLSFSPIQIGFVTLAEHKSIAPIESLRQALFGAAAG